jgi:hypothetical protein
MQAGNLCSVQNKKKLPEFKPAALRKIYKPVSKALPHSEFS